MDSSSKFLIRAACVVVILAGGYYLWNAYQSYAVQSARDRKTEAARQEIFDLAHAGENETDKVKSFCKSLNERLESEFKTNDIAKGVASNCRYFGYLD